MPNTTPEQVIHAGGTGYDPITANPIANEQWTVCGLDSKDGSLILAPERDHQKATCQHCRHELGL